MVKVSFCQAPGELIFDIRLFGMSKFIIHAPVLSFGVRACVHNRDTLTLIPSEMVALVSQSSSEPS